MESPLTPTAEKNVNYDDDIPLVDAWARLSTGAVEHIEGFTVLDMLKHHPDEIVCFSRVVVAIAVYSFELSPFWKVFIGSWLHKLKRKPELVVFHTFREPTQK